MDGYLDMTREDLEELKKLYEKAKPGEVFLFKGREVLREYAKYVIEYLEPKL
jgi:hypothetical protein